STAESVRFRARSANAAAEEVGVFATSATDSTYILGAIAFDKAVALLATSHPSLGAGRCVVLLLALDDAAVTATRIDATG
ncbi:hypothetical protein HK405_015027, partial [Cladochytrium tenue]